MKICIKTSILGNFFKKENMSTRLLLKYASNNSPRAIVNKNKEFLSSAFEHRSQE